MEQLIVLGADDAGEALTVQRAAYVTEAQLHGDLDLPPLRQSLSELATELTDPQVLCLGWRDSAGRLVAAVRAKVDDQCAEIGRLIVVPDLQGQRLGTRLLAALEEQLSSTVTELRMFTGEHSRGNLRLYTRLGYVETHRQATPAGYALIHLSKRRHHQPTQLI